MAKSLNGGISTAHVAKNKPREEIFGTVITKLYPFNQSLRHPFQDIPRHTRFSTQDNEACMYEKLVDTTPCRVQHSFDPSDLDSLLVHSLKNPDNSRQAWNQVTSEISRMYQSGHNLAFAAHLQHQHTAKGCGAVPQRVDSVALAGARVSLPVENVA